jgi:hypothetical protein
MRTGKKNPAAAFAVRTEGEIKVLDDTMPLLIEIRKLTGEKFCDLLNWRYGLEFEPGVRCTSPLRDEADNPTSFLINGDGKWHDFGAPDEDRAHGDIIDFVRIRESVDFITAVGIIAGEFEFDSSVAEIPEVAESQRRRKELCILMSEIELVVQYSELQLAVRVDIKEQIIARGFTEEYIHQHRLGFLDSVSGYRRWVDGQYSDVQHKLYVSNLEGRIIVPYFDATGSKVIYLIGRSL